MRIAFTVGFLCVACMTVRSAISGDNDKKRRDELEKELAQFDSELERTEVGKKAQQLIAEMAKRIEKAERVDLLRINPQPLGKDGTALKVFHGHEVLSEFTIGSKEKRKEVVGFLAKTLHWNWLRMALCFDPNHGMRVVSEGRNLDFLICFSCNRVRVFESDKFEGEFALRSSDEHNLIEQYLAESQKQLKDKK